MTVPSPAGQGGAQVRPVIVVGAGPVGTTAALLIADAGIPVIMLERHAEPHPLPRAVHLDDEAARILYRAGRVLAPPGGGRDGHGFFPTTVQRWVPRSVPPSVLAMLAVTTSPSCR